MILVGQYDSPYTRRVAVSLGLLGFDFEHDGRSVFADFESMRTTNPLGRVPSLILRDGTTLIDSMAILDWLDQQVGPERGLMPASGPARQDALQRIALATGTIDKVMGAATRVWCDRSAIGGRTGSLGAAPRPRAVSVRWQDRPGRPMRLCARMRSRRLA
jgi:glutathione S-transferase